MKRHDVFGEPGLLPQARYAPPAIRKSITDIFFRVEQQRDYSAMADEDFSTGDLFQDPDGFYPEEAQPTFAEHQMLSGETVRVRLVGSHPLYVWLHHMQKTCM
jgi:hypothetical protein